MDLSLSMAKRRKDLPLKALPRMSKNALRRTDKVGATCLLRSQGDDNGGRVGQSDLPNNGGPTRKRRTLQAKEQKYASHPKRSMELRLPNSSLVQVSGKHERFFCRLGFQGITAMAPRVA